MVGSIRCNRKGLQSSDNPVFSNLIKAMRKNVADTDVFEAEDKKCIQKKRKKTKTGYSRGC